MAPQPETGIVAASFTEKRANGRRRFNVAGSIMVDGSSTPIPCNVIDISKEGARIELHGFSCLPDTFTLSIANNRFSARVVWRSTQQFGLRFLSEEPAAE